MIINFENKSLVSIVTGHSKRDDLLFGVLGSLLVNCTGLRVAVGLNRDLDSTWFVKFSLFQEVARNNGNYLFSVNCGTTNGVAWSKARMVEELLLESSQEWVIFLDDDVLVPFYTLSLLKNAIIENNECRYVLFGHHDVMNHRNYPDWSDQVKVRGELIPDQRVWPFHLWVPNWPTLELIPTRFSSPSFALRKDVFLDYPQILEGWKSLERGQRGCDPLPAKVLGEHGEGGFWIFGSNIWHLGIGPWSLDHIVWKRGSSKTEFFSWQKEESHETR